MAFDYNVILSWKIVSLKCLKASPMTLYLHVLVDAVDMVVSPRHEKHVKVRGGN